MAVAAVGAAAMLCLGWMGVQATGLADTYAGRVLPGMSVDGVALEGMTFAEAEQRISDAASQILDRPVQVVAGALTTTLTRRQLGSSSNAAGVMSILRMESQQMSAWDWVRVRWFDGAPTNSPRLVISPVTSDAVDDAVIQLSTVLAVPAVDATMIYDDASITFGLHTDGQTLNQSAAADVLGRAFASDVRATPGRAELPVTLIPAAITTADLGQILYLDQSEHHLPLYLDGDLQGEWIVATGTAGYPTPTGEYFVELKRENPSWGGADNIRFHGTNQEWSLGSNASHGCVRMANADVVDLFDLVDVGATIISVS